MSARVCRACEIVDLTGRHHNVKFCPPCRTVRKLEQNRKHVLRHRSIHDGKQRGTLREVAVRGRVILLAWREDEPELAAMLDRERLRRGLATP